MNGAAYVVDCGNGVAIQLVRAGVPLSAVRHVFITHQHSDHNADYGNLLLLAWTSGLQNRVDTWGPPPLARMTRLFFEMSAYDMQARISDEGRAPLVPLVHPHEITGSGVVTKDENVRVTSVLVEHPPVTPAFAYRFDAPDRSIVISDKVAVDQQNRVKRMEKELADYRIQADRPFEHEERLKQLLVRQAELNSIIQFWISTKAINRAPPRLQMNQSWRVLNARLWKAATEWRKWRRRTCVDREALSEKCPSANAHHPNPVRLPQKRWRRARPMLHLRAEQTVSSSCQQTRSTVTCISGSACLCDFRRAACCAPAGAI